MEKNDLKRLNYKKFEKQNLILKILSNNQILDLKKREIYAKKRHLYTKKSSITLIRNNCINTGRNRGIIKNVGVSRLEFKRLIGKGLIPGIKKQ